jgi:hypothetical protein
MVSRASSSALGTASTNPWRIPRPFIAGAERGRQRDTGGDKSAAKIAAMIIPKMFNSHDRMKSAGHLGAASGQLGRAAVDG